MAKYISIVIATLITSQLKAQQTATSDTVNQLNKVTVTYQADKFSPVTFQNLNSNYIKAKSTGQEPSFLLSETPSITVYSDAGSTQGYSYYRIRGIDQTRVNMTLDGVPLNEPEDQGAYFSNYPDIFNSVSRVQVQRGVGTSKNGAASYGGSVQLFSPNLYDSACTTVGAGYGSYNSLRAFVEFNSGMQGHKALYVRASEIYSDGYKYNSSNHSQSVFISGELLYKKTIWKLNVLAGHQQNQLAWLGVTDSLIAIDRKTNADQNERDNFTQCMVQLQNNWRPRAGSLLQTSVYYTTLSGNYDFNLNAFLGLPSTNELYNYAFRSNVLGIFSNYTLSNKNVNWVTGVHANVYDRRHTGSINTMGQLYTNTGYKNEFSAFTKVDATVGKLILYADLQYRYANFDYNGSVHLDKIGWNFFNPKAGVSLLVSNHSTLYYNIGRTGREPTRNDLFGGSDDLLADSTGKPMVAIITPEYVVDNELGYRYLLKKLSLNVNLYYMAFTNEIVLDGKFGSNGLALTDKVDKSYRAGIELNVAYQVNKHITLIDNSSFNHSRIKEQKLTFTPILTPPVIVNQEVVYTNKKFLAGASARYQSSSYIDFANTTTVDKYILVNARFQYNINRLQLGLFINNITNAHYYNNGYVDVDGSKKYFVQAPANFYTSIKYSF